MAAAVGEEKNIRPKTEMEHCYQNMSHSSVVNFDRMKLLMLDLSEINNVASLLELCNQMLTTVIELT